MGFCRIHGRNDLPRLPQRHEGDRPSISLGIDCTGINKKKDQRSIYLILVFNHSNLHVVWFQVMCTRAETRLEDVQFERSELRYHLDCKTPKIPQHERLPPSTEAVISLTQPMLLRSQAEEHTNTTSPPVPTHLRLVGPPRHPEHLVKIALCNGARRVETPRDVHVRPGR